MNAPTEVGSLMLERDEVGLGRHLPAKDAAPAIVSDAPRARRSQSRVGAHELAHVADAYPCIAGSAVEPRLNVDFNYLSSPADHEMVA